jgi:hypothetical protein
MYKTISYDILWFEKSDLVEQISSKVLAILRG